MTVELFAAFTAQSSWRVAEEAGYRRGVRLTRCELAGRLAGLSVPAMHYGLAKWAGDEAALRLAVGFVQVHAAELACAQDWEVVRGRPTIMMLAKAATEAGVFDQALSARQVAKLAQVPWTTFWRVWNERYELLRDYVADLEHEVLVKLSY